MGMEVFAYKIVYTFLSASLNHQWELFIWVGSIAFQYLDPYGKVDISDKGNPSGGDFLSFSYAS